MSETPLPDHAQLPLQGVRIIAVEQYGAGPYASMLLADLGAQVIKIENPHQGGDVGRSVPPFTADQDSLYFQSWNRNKQSLTLDLKHPRASEVFHPLVRSADAVVNNLRGDVPAKLGLDYAALGAIKPAVVCASLSAFGRTGSRATQPGYDYLMQGYAGWMSICGEPDGPPQKTGLSLVDLGGGALTALGVTAAILRARATGQGCDVDVNLFHASLAQMTYLAVWHLNAGYQPQRMADSAHPSQVPSQILPTRDGWMVVMCAKEKFYKSLVRIMGAPQLADDPRFGDFERRLANRAELIPILKDLSRQKTTAQWMDLFAGEVPCAPVNTIEQAFEDALVSEQQMVTGVPHPHYGTVRQVTSPIRISDAPATYERAPMLGEHTDAILQQDLSMTKEGVDTLRDAGVI